MCTVHHSQISLFKHLQIICCRKHIPTTSSTKLHYTPLRMLLLAWMHSLLKLMFNSFYLPSMSRPTKPVNAKLKQSCIEAVTLSKKSNPWLNITWCPSWPSPAGISQCSRCQTEQSKCSSERMWLLRQNGLKWPSVLVGLPSALGNHFWGNKNQKGVITASKHNHAINELEI